MKVFNKIVDLQNELFAFRKEGRVIGLVPTMGALHEGHASLVRRSVAENDITVVSVFLNPTQFNDPNDLERYPRTLDADCRLLEQVGADYVFAPSFSEMYPVPDTRRFEFPPVTTVMEGAKRPGHFNGVCQVVSRLFYITRPTRAYFGEKDWQQIAVIKQLVRFLTPGERVIAPTIYQTMLASVDYAKAHSVQETLEKVTSDINSVDGLEVEYFSIVDGDTLQEIDSWDDSPNIVGCITVYCGTTPIRLIDHIKYKEPKIGEH